MNELVPKVQFIQLICVKWHCKQIRWMNCPKGTIHSTYLCEMTLQTDKMNELVPKVQFIQLICLKWHCTQIRWMNLSQRYKFIQLICVKCHCTPRCMNLSQRVISFILSVCNVISHPVVELYLWDKFIHLICLQCHFTPCCWTCPKGTIQQQGVKWHCTQIRWMNLSQRYNSTTSVCNVISHPVVELVPKGHFIHLICLQCHFTPCCWIVPLGQRFIHLICLQCHFTPCCWIVPLVQFHSTYLFAMSFHTLLLNCTFGTSSFILSVCNVISHPVVEMSKGTITTLCEMTLQTDKLNELVPKVQFIHLICLQCHFTPCCWIVPLGQVHSSYLFAMSFHTLLLNCTFGTSSFILSVCNVISHPVVELYLWVNFIHLICLQCHFTPCCWIVPLGQVHNISDKILSVCNVISHPVVELYLWDPKVHSSYLFAMSFHTDKMLLTQRNCTITFGTSSFILSVCNVISHPVVELYLWVISFILSVCNVISHPVVELYLWDKFIHLICLQCHFTPCCWIVPLGQRFIHLICLQCHFTPCCWIVPLGQVHSSYLFAMSFHTLLLNCTFGTSSFILSVCNVISHPVVELYLWDNFIHLICLQCHFTPCCWIVPLGQFIHLICLQCHFTPCCWIVPLGQVHSSYLFAMSFHTLLLNCTFGTSSFILSVCNVISHPVVELYLWDKFIHLICLQCHFTPCCWIVPLGQVHSSYLFAMSFHTLLLNCTFGTSVIHLICLQCHFNRVWNDIANR